MTYRFTTENLWSNSLSRITRAIVHDGLGRELLGKASRTHKGTRINAVVIASQRRYRVRIGCTRRRDDIAAIRRGIKEGFRRRHRGRLHSIRAD